MERGNANTEASPTMNFLRRFLLILAAASTLARNASAFQPRVVRKAPSFPPSATGDFRVAAGLFPPHIEVPSEHEEGSKGGIAAVTSRRDCLRRVLASSAAGATALLTLRADGGAPFPAAAFEGGVGGLGKTKPETGVVFRDPDGTCADPGPGGTVTNELLSPDGTPALVAFDAPWPMLRSSVSVESRDLANPEAAFVQVAKVPGAKGAGELPKSFFEDTIFGQKGKFGAYGAPSDIKVKKTDPGSASGIAMYVASFSTLTPAMRESERQAFISASVVGDGVFMLVTGTTAPRFRKLEKDLRKVAESFSVVPAPKTALRSSS